jgi:uncharacterized phiE125 gp8 family phage protein
MSLIQTIPPAGEPLALADLKAFLRLDGAEEDALVAATAAAARAHLEAMTGRLFLAQGWRIRRDTWPPTGRLILPIGPIRSLDAVTVTGEGGSSIAVPVDRFALDGTAAPPRLAWRAGSLPQPATPLAGIAIDVTCGFGAAADVPPSLLQALRLLTAHWFENRSLIAVGHEVAVIPRMVEDLVAPFIMRRIA